MVECLHSSTGREREVPSVQLINGITRYLHARYCRDLLKGLYANSEHTFSVCHYRHIQVGILICGICFEGHEPAFRDKKIVLLDESSEQKLLELPKEFNSRVCALSLGTKNFLSGT